jgi:hypothetical protein
MRNFFGAAIQVPAVSACYVDLLISVGIDYARHRAIHAVTL